MANIRINLQISKPIQSPINTYADESILHYLIIFNKWQSQGDVNNLRIKTIERLTSNFLNEAEETWHPVLPQKPISANCQLDKTFQTSIHYSLETYNCFPASTRKIFSLFLAENLNWNLHIYFLAKSPSTRLGFLYNLLQFFSPTQMLTVYKSMHLICGRFNSYS